MKTAKEILNETIFTEEGFTNYELEVIIDCMEEYANQKLHSPPANSSGNLAAGVDWDAIEKAFMEFNNGGTDGTYPSLIETFNWFKNRLTDKKENR